MDRETETDVTFPIVCPRLEAKFVRKSIASRSLKRAQNHEIMGPGGKVCPKVRIGR